MIPKQKRILELEAESAELKSLVNQLLQEIDRLKHPKNSRNSSVAPSKDENRPLKTTSLRVSDGKSLGGQVGNEGSTLKIVENPDIVIDYKPTFCKQCSDELSNTPAELIKSRQIVNIPPIILLNEHKVGIMQFYHTIM